MTGMKSKTIKIVLRNKIEDWLSTIKDETLATELKQNIIITGGCITSMLLGEKVNDFDIYFKSIDIVQRVAEYYVNVFNNNNGELSKKKTVSSCINPVVQRQFKVNLAGVKEERVIIFMKSSGIASENQTEYGYFESESAASTDKFFESIEENDFVEVIPEFDDPMQVVQYITEDEKIYKHEKYRPVFLSDNAITLSHKIQLIIRFYGQPEDIHKNYDFVHTTNYYDYDTDDLVLNPQALESILSKSLVYQGSLYPLASVFRTRKFIERGWRITAGQMLKMIFQISKMDLNNYETLREQLIGVDFAYFGQLLRMIENDKPKMIDHSYLSNLIDKVFE